jgi:DNA-binding NarL/FixJ family response regulator
LLANLNNIEVIAEATQGEEALTLATELKPDLVLMDIQMPNLNGLESTLRLSKNHPDIKVIIVSMYKNKEYILRALRSGAAGYFLKDSGPKELERAIRAVMRGETYLDSHLAESLDDYLLKLNEVTDPLQKLTSRQRQVLALLAQGHSSKDMAKELGISLKTIEAHRSQIMRTLDIHPNSEIVKQED